MGVLSDRHVPLLLSRMKYPYANNPERIQRKNTYTTGTWVNIKNNVLTLLIPHFELLAAAYFIIYCLEARARFIFVQLTLAARTCRGQLLTQSNPYLVMLTLGAYFVCSNIYPIFRDEIVKLWFSWVFSPRNTLLIFDIFGTNLNESCLEPALELIRPRSTAFFCAFWTLLPQRAGESC